MSITLVLPFDLGTTQGGIADDAALTQPVPHAVVGFLDNGKVRARELLDAIGAALVEEGVIVEYFVHRKREGLLPLEDEEREEVLGRAEVLVTGVGDCGGCTAATVTDAVHAHEAGIPAFSVVTTNFEALARSVTAEFDVRKPTILLVDHPIWTRDLAWIETTGKTLAAIVADRLTNAVGRTG